MISKSPISNLLEGEFGCIDRCQLQKEANALIVREIIKKNGLWLFVRGDTFRLAEFSDGARDGIIEFIGVL